MQQIADGLQTAGFGVDLNIFMWLLLDEGFRKMQDVFTPYEDWEKVGQSVSRVITPANAEDYLRSEEHTSELQSLMRISYAVFCLKKKKNKHITYQQSTSHHTLNNPTHT